MARADPHFRLRIPEAMKSELEEAARKSGRSINSEILVRLQQSLDGYFLDLSGEGFVQLVKRFEATLGALEYLFFAQRNLTPGVGAQSIEEPTNVRPTPEEWNILRSAPQSMHREIIAALADGDIDMALGLAITVAPRPITKP